VDRHRGEDSRLKADRHRSALHGLAVSGAPRPALSDQRGPEAPSQARCMRLPLVPCVPASRVVPVAPPPSLPHLFAVSLRVEALPGTA
jgi:hypothetical protein